MRRDSIHAEPPHSSGRHWLPGYIAGQQRHISSCWGRKKNGRTARTRPGFRSKTPRGYPMILAPVSNSSVSFCTSTRCVVSRRDVTRASAIISACCFHSISSNRALMDCSEFQTSRRTSAATSGGESWALASTAPRPKHSCKALKW